jgi:hypothetical protein
MEDLAPKHRYAPDELIKQRAAHQISEIKFEESKRALLGEGPRQVPVLTNVLIIAAIGAVMWGHARSFIQRIPMRYSAQVVSPAAFMGTKAYLGSLKERENLGK